ncbi:hypothetical protein [Krasilnikovia sp. M28-CT-15]|uniref:hypothetical protein n=1 Tax=Krasilnikovia sp. M28-CT-15 TaxID=3373540 RepID=UPI00399C559A
MTVHGRHRIIASVSNLDGGLAHYRDAREDQPRGERQAVRTDPDGHGLCLVSPRG